MMFTILQVFLSDQNDRPLTSSDDQVNVTITMYFPIRKTTPPPTTTTTHGGSTMPPHLFTLEPALPEPKRMRK